MALRDIVRSGESGRLRQELQRLPADQRATSLQDLSSEERLTAFHLLGASTVATLIHALPSRTVAPLIQDLPSDDLADLLGELQPDVRDAIIGALPSPHRERAVRLLRYGRDTAGGRMAEEFMAFPVTIPLADVIERLKRESPPRDRPLYLYGIDADGRLIGVLPTRDLILEPASRTVAEVMRPDPLSVHTATDQEEVAHLFLRHRLMALPVVDADRRLAGIVTPDDVAAIIEEETTEDLLKLSGSREDDDTRSVRRIIAGRLPWLTINLLLNVVAVSVVAYFEGVIQAVVAVSVLLPIISDMGGNTGIQALSVMIRKLATGRVDFGQFWPVFRREALAALIHGAALGLLLGLVAWWWKGIPALGLVAALALWINTMVAGVTGALIPLVLHRLHLDPASSSGPILTTVTDMTGFFATLQLASLLLRYLTPTT